MTIPALSERALLLSLVAVLLACSRAPVDVELPAEERLALDGGPAPTCPIDAGTCVPVADVSELEGACLDNRWVGRVADWNGACPAGPNGEGGRWTESQLFSFATGPTWTVPARLATYCVYEWQPGAGSLAEPDVTALAQIIGPQMAALDRDCDVLHASASLAVEIEWPRLREHFHAQSQRLPTLPLGPTAPADIRVAVLDSLVSGYDEGKPGVGKLGHGRALALMIRELACPNVTDPLSACIGQISNHLTLPLDEDRTLNWTEGGYFGRVTSYASSAVEAVNEWRLFNYDAQANNTDPHPRLILNASVAWDPRWGGDFPGMDTSVLPAPMQAAYDAIRHARCYGALVVAAAGNNPGGPHANVGAMYPGGWETKPAPSAATCSALEGPGYSPSAPLPRFAPAGSYDPLVVAVGGVRADHEPIENAREEGHPRLAAPSSHGVATDVDEEAREVPSDVLNGTSVGAAAVSGSAAVIWGYRPSLSPAEVAALLWSAGDPLDRKADFCLGGAPCPVAAPANEVRELALCAALHEACAGGLENCPAALPTCAAKPNELLEPSAEVLDALEEEVARCDASDAGPCSYSASEAVVVLPPLEVCKDAPHHTVSEQYPPAACPTRQYYGAHVVGWTAPQPGSNPCPDCLLVLTDVIDASRLFDLYISISPEYKGGTLDEPVLLIEGHGYVDLSVSKLVAGDEVIVRDIKTSDSVWKAATLEFTLYAHDGSVSSTTSAVTIKQ